MRIRITALLCIITICLTACATEKHYTVDELAGRFESEFNDFQAVAAILASAPGLRGHLRDELHTDYNCIYYFGNMIHDDDALLPFISPDGLDLLKDACDGLEPANAAYTALNMYDISGSLHTVESIEIMYYIDDSEYADASYLSFYYIISEEDRAYVSENPFRWYAGTTARLQPTSRDGWYIHIYR